MALRDLMLVISSRIREELLRISKDVDLESVNVEFLRKSTPKPIAGVDGGYSTILVTPMLALHYVRIAHVTVDVKGKVGFGVSEYIVYSKVEGDHIKYEAYDMRGLKVIKEAPEVAIKREGLPTMDFERATLKAMTYLELLHAAKIAREGYHIVLRDGTLNVHPYPVETRLVANRIFGVSKTSSSPSIVRLPLKLYEKAGPWISPSYVDIPSGKRGMVELLKYMVYDIVQVPVRLSKYGKPLIFEAFKVEKNARDTYERIKSAASTILNFIDETGNYPYPLVEADRLAGVRKGEAEAISARILEELELIDPELASNLKVGSLMMRREWRR